MSASNKYVLRVQVLAKEDWREAFSKMVNRERSEQGEISLREIFSQEWSVNADVLESPVSHTITHALVRGAMCEAAEAVKEAP